MKTTLLATIITIVISLIPAKAQVNDNAALMYWKASALAQELPGEGKDVKKIVENGEKLSQAYLDSLKQNRDAIKYAMKGAQLPDCHFLIVEIEKDEGAELLLPHLARMSQIGSLLVLDGMRCCEEGNWEEAANRYIAAMRLAYHINQDNILISYLIMRRIGNLCLIAISRTIQNDKVPVAILENLKNTLNSIYPSISMAKALACEKYLFIPYVQKLLKGDNAASVVASIVLFLGESESQTKLLETLFDPSTGMEERKKICEKIKIPVEVSVSQKVLTDYLLKGIEEHKGYVDRLIEYYEQPYPIAKQNLAKMEADLANANIVVRQALPAIFPLFDRFYDFKASLKIMAAGIDLKIYKKMKNEFPKSLKEMDGEEKYKDPFTGNLFEYEIKEGRAILKSAGKADAGKEIKIEIQ